MSLQSDLARVRGLGSAKDGTQHFWHQRLTAIALVPLTLWFVVGMLCAATGSHAEAVAWIAKPHVTALFIALAIAMFYHLKLGLQTVIEDYIHTEWLKLCGIIGLNFASALGVLLAVVAILKISFGMTGHG